MGNIQISGEMRLENFIYQPTGGLQLEAFYVQTKWSCYRINVDPHLSCTNAATQLPANQSPDAKAGAQVVDLWFLPDFAFAGKCHFAILEASTH
jgi:hypothetical protein